ncbi:S1 family peptidase [Motilibacter deserti]|uniref:Trypsin-like serine protease n=1 Tax=Motilibacter deserti TaxID=2714956 RepID=A0ABX0GR11_9ACTN|nr:trypsin-like serine protease [Motilibacter deserti]
MSVRASSVRSVRRRGLALLLAPLTALALLPVLGPAAPASAVTYGTVVGSPGTSAPWALSLWRGAKATGAVRFLCTATAIAPQVVVTAAHCVQQKGFFYVETDAKRLGQGERVPVEAITDHPGYRSGRFRDDIAVLRPLLPLDLPSYATAGSAALARSVKAGRQLSLGLYGWGLDERDRIGRLRSATLRTAPDAVVDVFGRAFAERSMIAAGRPLASGGYAGGCNGDSGGPLVVGRGSTRYLVGVTSFGAEGCDQDLPTVFTSVGDYTHWLSTAASSLRRLATTANRALPVATRAPALRGDAVVGGAVTCDPGAWTANATRVTQAWFRGQVRLEDAPVHQVVPQDAGATLRCVVTAVSGAGKATRTLRVAVPALSRTA